MTPVASPTEALQAALFSQDQAEAFVILDGAGCDGLTAALAANQPDHECLYAGELDASIEEVAPYLVRLDPDHPFTRWLFREMGHKPWGVFLNSSLGIRGLRKHFRGFLLVKSPEGNTVYFRYYDPRVLSAYLPTTNEAEQEQVFGPVIAFYCITPDGILRKYERQNGKLLVSILPVVDDA